MPSLHLPRSRRLAAGSALLWCAMILPAPAQTLLAHTTTYLDVQPAATAQAVALVKQYARATRADDGNRQVIALEELGRPNRLVIMETWKDSESLTQHERASHTQDFRQHLKALERSPDDERLTHDLAVDDAPWQPSAREFYVVTHVDVPSAKREEGESLLSDMVGQSRRQPGHLHYDIYQQNEPRLNHFTLFAVWSGRRAFDDYGRSAPWLRFREKLAPLLGALYDERLYQRVR